MSNFHEDIFAWVVFFFNYFTMTINPNHRSVTDFFFITNYFIFVFFLSLLPKTLTLGR